MVQKFRKLLIFESLVLLMIVVTLSGFATPIEEDTDEYIMEEVEVSVVNLSARSDMNTRQERWESLGEFNLTAYCSCKKCCGKWANNRPKDEYGNDIVYTSTGTIAKAGRTIAVDPTVIPYGSQIKIGDTIYTAEDSGSAIKGNDIDVYHDNHQVALQFGRQKQEVYILVTE